MASISPFPARNLHRVSFKTPQKRKQKYAKTEPEAKKMKLELDEMEAAIRMEMASRSNIEEWIRKKYLTTDEAALAFPDFRELLVARESQGLEQTDYDKLLDLYETWSAGNARGGVIGRPHASNMSRARQCIEWLKANKPTLATVKADDVDAYLSTLMVTKGKGEDKYTVPAAPKTVWNLLQIIRSVFDIAVKHRMMQTNVARQVQRRQPKTVRRRRVLTQEEIDWVKEAPFKYTHWVSECLPTVMMFGLYCALRDEEMIWAQWDKIDWKMRTYAVEETIDPNSGIKWMPKGASLRVVPISKPLLKHLKKEKARQEKAKTLGAFILSGKKRLHVDSVINAWRKMVEDQNKPSDLTIYTLRHTCLTMLLRSVKDGGAGKDIRTVQAFAGHEDVKTTETYTHPLGADTNFTDDLQY